MPVNIIITAETAADAMAELGTIAKLLKVSTKLNASVKETIDTVKDALPGVVITLDTAASGPYADPNDAPSPPNTRTPEEQKQRAIDMLLAVYPLRKDIVTALLTKYGVKKFSAVPLDRVGELVADAAQVAAS